MPDKVYKTEMIRDIVSFAILEKLEGRGLNKPHISAWERPTFQPRVPRELSETIRMLLEEYRSEDLATYYAIENAYVYYR